jgi:hypothetical protein
MQTSRTSLVINEKFGIFNNFFNLPPYYYRVRNCDTNMTANTPANQYQRQKLIQNTVRVYSSLYTMNLGSLTAYTKPPVEPYGGVCWNQMSDRPVPSVQKTTVPTGTNCSLNRRNTSVTSSRPGCQSPGGVGCDIKHNSYDRYLNRLKGKGPLRRGDIPYGFGVPQIPFNLAYPVYGGKVMKTNIVNDCNCPILANPTNNDYPIYNIPTLYNPNEGEQFCDYKCNCECDCECNYTVICVNNDKDNNEDNESIVQDESICETETEPVYSEEENI